MTSPKAGRQSLINHLEARLASGDIERALGGFALLLIKLYDGRETGREMEASEVSDTLAAISTRLRTILRDSDFLTQFDEHTFAVVIPQISDRTTAEGIIQKLRSAFLLPIAGNGGDGPDVFSPKFGVALFPVDGVIHQTLIAHAEKVM